jgi:hypothetical protein
LEIRVKEKRRWFSYLELGMSNRQFRCVNSGEQHVGLIQPVFVADDLEQPIGFVSMSDDLAVANRHILACIL